MATQSSREMVDEMSRADAARMSDIAQEVAGTAGNESTRDTIHAFDQAFARGADLAWEITDAGEGVAVAVNPNFKTGPREDAPVATAHADLPGLVRQIPGGAELWQYGGKYFLAGRARTASGYLLAGR